MIVLPADISEQSSLVVLAIIFTIVHNYQEMSRCIPPCICIGESPIAQVTSNNPFVTIEFHVMPSTQ